MAPHSWSSWNRAVESGVVQLRVVDRLGARDQEGIAVSDRVEVEHSRLARWRTRPLADLYRRRIQWLGRTAHLRGAFVEGTGDSSPATASRSSCGLHLTRVRVPTRRRGTLAAGLDDVTRHSGSSTPKRSRSVSPRRNWRCPVIRPEVVSRCCSPAPARFGSPPRSPFTRRSTSWARTQIQGFTPEHEVLSVTTSLKSVFDPSVRSATSA